MCKHKKLIHSHFYVYIKEIVDIGDGLVYNGLVLDTNLDFFLCFHWLLALT